MILTAVRLRRGAGAVQPVAVPVAPVLPVTGAALVEGTPRASLGIVAAATHLVKIIGFEQ